ncbi:hypothetical protein TNCV_3610361 [Trichonephila clavipes]|nr:hypothetical protein TNCV_3610361 [Trichonephila clavipes]
MVSMLMLGKTRQTFWHKISGSMKLIVFILECLHPPRSPTRRQCAVVIWQIPRHGAYLKYTPEYSTQNQGEDPTGKRGRMPLICNTNPAAVCLRETTQNSEHMVKPINIQLLTPVYSEAWVKKS